LKKPKRKRGRNGGTMIEIATGIRITNIEQGTSNNEVSQI
jgi:hypothetical protein